MFKNARFIEIKGIKKLNRYISFSKTFSDKVSNTLDKSLKTYFFMSAKTLQNMQGICKNCCYGETWLWSVKAHETILCEKQELDE